MNKLIATTLISLLSVSALAVETSYEPKDCGFTNSELQTGLEQFLVPALAKEGIDVRLNSLKVEDSTVDPYSINTTDFGLAKRISFKVESGEQLSLENLTGYGLVDKESTHPAIFIVQGELQTFSDLGVKLSSQCIAGFPNAGISMMLKNSTTQKSLPALTEKVRRQLAPSSGSLTFFAKDLF